MERVEDSQKEGNVACSEGGPCLHQVYLEPGEYLRPGRTYGYKLIEIQSTGESVWLMNPSAALHTMVDGCLNSGFRLPECTSGPTIRIAQARHIPGASTLEIDASIELATDSDGIDEVIVELNGAVIPHTLDDTNGHIVVRTDALRRGKNRLRMRATDAEGRTAPWIYHSTWVEEVPFRWQAGPMYLLFIDRFSDGDPSNNDPLPEVTTPSVQWSGGDLQGATAAINAGYFDALGVKTIWLSPVNAQINAAMPGRVSPRLIAPYHGYWPISGREVDPRFGGDQALRHFIDAAHERGIRVLLDLINNQVHEEHEYVQEHPEWFRTDCVCGLAPGCGWSERPFECLFAPYLPDIDWTHPGAQAQFIDDAVYWVEEYGIDGFRVDAVKHVESMAVFNLRQALSERFERGGDRIVMFGETAVSEGDRFSGLCGVQFNDGYDWINGYVGQNALDGQFDFPSYHRWAPVIDGSDRLNQIAAAMGDAERRYIDPDLNVLYLGSHDTPRIVSRVAGAPGRYCRFADECDGELPPEQSGAGADAYRRLRILWGLLYTTRGIPLLYYGDEIALSGGGDPDNRRPLPMIPTPETVSTLEADRATFFDYMGALGHLRNRAPSLQLGDRVTLWENETQLAYARRLGDSWTLSIAQLRPNTSMDILRRPWMGEVNDWDVLLGDVRIETTDDGWRFISGDSGFSVIQPASGE